MSDSDSAKSATNSKIIWAGRGVSALVGATFLMSAVMKLMGGSDLEHEMAHLGFPLNLVVPLAILEIVCAVIYIVPMTSIIGAVLLTGYMGGAICTHWRVGDPFFAPIIVGVLVWLGLYLRDERLRALMPLRR